LAPLLGGFALEASILGLALIVVVAVVNRALEGAWLIAIGSSLNLLVTSINGGMPVDPGALANTGKEIPHDGLHVLLGPESRLGFLADFIALPVINNIYSIGDFFLAIGGFWIVFRILRRR
jgi:hypothetical protein